VCRGFGWLLGTIDCSTSIGVIFNFTLFQSHRVCFVVVCQQAGENQSKLAESFTRLLSDVAPNLAVNNTIVL
jgi:hypothetical protein